MSKDRPLDLSPDEVWRHLDSLTKPPRSLGRLEELAHRLCVIQKTTVPRTRPRRLVLFAADHGVVASGVSAWPCEVTALVVQTILAGKAASTVLARESATETVLVNVGVRHEVSWDAAAADAVVYRDARVCAGTRNMAEEPALLIDEFARAADIGRNEAGEAVRAGMQVVLAGEMGIGNTTSAACLAMLLADVPLVDAVGRGAGANDATFDRKRKVVQASVERSRQIWKQDAVAAIASVAGLEIGAMAGFFIAAHNAGLTILLDGYVASSAALIAEHLQPGTASSMIAAHLSAEPGHRSVLERLGLEPFLKWDMRLGEGTGALLLLPLLDAAAQITGGMGTLTSVGVAKRDSQ